MPPLARVMGVARDFRQDGPIDLKALWAIRTVEALLYTPTCPLQATPLTPTNGTKELNTVPKPEQLN